MTLTPHSVLHHLRTARARWRFDPQFSHADSVERESERAANARQTAGERQATSGRLTLSAVAGVPLLVVCLFHHPTTCA